MRTGVQFGLVAACLFSAAAPAVGQTYVWAGDVFGHWSDPANWLGGVAPTSGPGVRVVANGGLNDLSGLRIGTLEVAGHWPQGEPLGLLESVAVLETAVDDGWTAAPLALEGHVTVKTGRFPYWLPDGPNDAWDLPPISGAGRLEVDGAVRVLDSTFTGAIDVLETSLFAIEGFDGDIANRGVLDFAGVLAGDYDGRGGVLSNQGNVNAFAPPSVVAADVTGDALLGRWYLGGIGEYPAGPVNDTLRVGGTLDLTEASLEGAIVFTADLDQPLPDALVLATYGGRVGTFAQATIPVAAWAPDFSRSVSIDGRLAYVDGTAGHPGQVLVLLPESSSLAVLAAGGLALVRRGRRRGEPGGHRYRKQ